MSSPTPKIPLLKKISLILFGIFISSLTFAISLRITQEYGIYLGFALAGSFIGARYYFLPNSPSFKIITHTMIVTIGIGGLVLWGLFAYLKASLEFLG